MSLAKETFGDNNPGYIYGDASAPGVVVIQEWWGVTDNIKEQAKYIADKLSVRVLIPDLYKGKVGVDAEEAHHLVDNLDWPTARDELTAAVAHLKQNGRKVGVIGFCMGGALSLIAAQHSAADAAVCFYGTPQEQICQVEKIKIPVLLQFGEKDGHEGFAQPPQAHGVADKIKGAGGNVTLDIYPGVGHAFMNTDESAQAKIGWGGTGTKPANIDEVRQESWQKTFAFLTEHLIAA